MQVKIVIKKSSGTTESLVFDHPAEMLIGRGRECGIRLASDLQVSRKHAMVHIDPPLAKIRDLGSTNGFSINDRKIGGANGEADREYIVLKNGDQIRCGDCRLIFEIGPRIRNLAADTRLIGPPEPLPQVPGYLLKKRLGKGDLGELYLASDERLDRVVAIRVMRSTANLSPRIRETFRHEGDTLRALEHPRLAALLDFGVEDDFIFVVSEYLPGGNVSDYLKRTGIGRLAHQDALALVMQAAEGLAFAHDHGVVHRGINPHSLLLDGAADQPGLKVGDLATARIFEDSGLSWLIPNYAGNSNLGYTPPEQILDFREARASADVFSLAAVLYKTLTGHSPYDFSDDVEPIEVVTQARIVPVEERFAGLPTPITVVIDRGLSADPDERYRDAGELLEALRIVG